MFLAAVCLSVCLLFYSKTCERIFLKFFGGAGHGPGTMQLDFDGDPDND